MPTNQISEMSACNLVTWESVFFFFSKEKFNYIRQKRSMNSFHWLVRQKTNKLVTDCFLKMRRKKSTTTTEEKDFGIFILFRKMAAPYFVCMINFHLCKVLSTRKCVGLVVSTASTKPTDEKKKKKRKTIWIENHLLVYASMKINDVPNLHVKWQPNKFRTNAQLNDIRTRQTGTATTLRYSTQYWLWLTWCRCNLISKNFQLSQLMGDFVLFFIDC